MALEVGVVDLEAHDIDLTGIKVELDFELSAAIESMREVGCGRREFSRCKNTTDN